MKHQQVHTNTAPKAIGPYSQAISTDTFVFTSGQIPMVPENSQIIHGDIKAQTRQVFSNLKAVLEAAGTSFENVVKVTVFLKDMNDFKDFNSVYEEYLGNVKPARSTVQVARLPLDVSVEIEMIAIK